MIGSLRGRIIDRETVIERSAAAEVLLEAAGVGYRVLVTAATLDRLRMDEEVLLYIHHHIREADQKLYGFGAKAERQAFEGLLAAHGVGPALALAVLATHPADRLSRILADDDLQALCEVPGVGKKTAQRLLIELRSSFVILDLDSGADQSSGVNGATTPASTALSDTREALTNLGYTPEEVRRALAAIDTDNERDAGQLLKKSLRVLAGG